MIGGDFTSVDITGPQFSEGITISGNSNFPENLNFCKNTNEIQRKLK